MKIGQVAGMREGPVGQVPIPALDDTCDTSLSLYCGVKNGAQVEDRLQAEAVLFEIQAMWLDQLFFPELNLPIRIHAEDIPISGWREVKLPVGRLAGNGQKELKAGCLPQLMPAAWLRTYSGDKDKICPAMYGVADGQ